MKTFSGKKLSKPQGFHVAKEDQKALKKKDCVIRAQAKVIVSMVFATLKKTKIMED